MRFLAISRWSGLVAAGAIAMSAGTAALANPTWDLSAGAQTDDAGASSFDADVGFSPTSRFTLSLAAGHVSGDSDSGDFSATTTSIAADWQALPLLGFGVGYDSWNDANTYEKQTVRASMYVGGPRVRVGVIGESISSETTAEQIGLRRSISLSFDGSGVGLDLHVTGSRADAYITYMSYDYEDNVTRLVTFLSSPTLATRPRLEALLSSGLTAAGALLDSSATVGGDVFVRDARLGASLSQFKDIISGDQTRAVQADFEWPLSEHWSARLSAGVNDSEADDSTLFGGARVLFHSK